MLLVVNPHATVVSEDLKTRVVETLSARFLVDPVDTRGRGDGVEIARTAASERYDLVVTLGGDGTVNEVANGLAGSDTTLACLPGGRTNVFCRALGRPEDVPAATEAIVDPTSDARRMRIDLGLMNGRHFVFASGIGLGASTNARVDRHPRLKSRLGEHYFALAGMASLAREYLWRRPRLRVTAGGRSVDGVTVVAQNTDPLTYFGRRPARVCEGAGVTTGTISLAALKRATPLELLVLPPRVLGSGRPPVTHHPQVHGFARVERARVEGLGGHLLPVEVDGDYLGDLDVVEYGVRPSALSVLA